MTSVPTHLLLPREEAVRFQKTGRTRLLYPIPELLAAPGSFRLSSGTSEQFPAREQVNGLPSPTRAAWATSAPDANGWVEVLNAGRLWNFLGDATHSTPLLQVPFGLALDQDVTLENRYNVAPRGARVSCIELTRLQSDLTWYWLIELSALPG